MPGGRKNKSRVNQSARVRILFGLLFILALVFIGRLSYLQVFAGEEMREAALSQRRRDIEIRPERGDIYDREGEELASSIQVKTAYLYPAEVDAEDREGVINDLSRILGLSPEQLATGLDSGKNRVRLKSRLSQTELDQIQASYWQCVGIEQESQRYYPGESLLSQTLGFLDDQGHGLYGLEAYYDERLYGTAGRSVYSRDLNGNRIPTESSVQQQAVRGDDLYLTIDSRLQSILQEELQKGIGKYQADSATAILMDPNTGSILAMENLPSFDPNQPNDPIDPKLLSQWEGMGEEKRLNALYEHWKNPAVSSVYEPGSVFKSLTASIALETGAVDKNSRFFSAGSLEAVPGVYIHDSNRQHKKTMDSLETALGHSYNTAFAQVMKSMGPKAFFSYLEALHIGGKSGIDLPAEAGSELAASPGNIQPLSLTTMAYGHSLSLTPVQLLSAVNSIINGGYYYQPHLLSKAVDAEGKEEVYQPAVSSPIFSEATQETMKSYLQSGLKISESPLLEVGGMSFGGKSGTTEIVENGKYTDKTIASYFSYYPADHPQYSLLVVAHQPKTNAFGVVVGGGISKEIWLRIKQEVLKGGKIK